MDGKGTPVRALVHYVDSQPAIDPVNPVYNARIEHVLAKYHFIRDCVDNEGELAIRKVDTIDMGADMLP